MVFLRTLLPGGPEEDLLAAGRGEEVYFKHILGYGGASKKLAAKQELASEVLKVAIRRSFTPRNPATQVMNLVGKEERHPGLPSPRLSRSQNPKIKIMPSPKLLRGRSAVHKVRASPERYVGERVRGSSPRYVPNSPQLGKSSGRDSPKFIPSSPLLLLKADSPHNSGRVRKPTWKPKKSVHWKTNIATWIQMTAMNSSMSMSEMSNCGDSWSRGLDGDREADNDSSDDDGTERFNTADKSVCRATTGKEDDSSDFEYTDFSKVNGRTKEKRYFGLYPTLKASDKKEKTPDYLVPKINPTLKKPLPPLPPYSPPGANDQAEYPYYSELNCSCSSSHTYEDVEDSLKSLDGRDTGRRRHDSDESNHTYCEIEQVARGSKPEVFGSLLRNDSRLDALKSTLVHVLPKDDIISTTLLACRLGDLEYLQDLSKQSRLDAGAQDLQGASCLHYAARGGHVHVLRFLVDDKEQRGVVQCEVGATPLHDAAALGTPPSHTVSPKVLRDIHSSSRTRRTLPYFM